MTRGSILDYAKAAHSRYLKASKREKALILDEFCQNSGYHRKAAIRLLRRDCIGRARRGGRKRKYGLAVSEAVKKLWDASDRICSKRLAPFIPELLDALERHGEISLETEVREQVVGLSAATIDRLLKPYRPKKLRLPYTQGRASSTLKAQIPIRTFGDWAGVQPGAFQADLVMHCGETTEGLHLCTLDIVDVATGWNECQPVMGKGQQRVGTAVHHARQRLPMPLRELHTDNGSEFLNEVLYPWCKREGIRFTRGRPYKKNDQAHVEQKNWSCVRRLIGYDRYTSKAAYEQFAAFYALRRLYVNFFQPIRKITGRERIGAKVKKTFDEARTPYQRLLAAGVLDDAKRKELAAEYERINPVRLRAQIDRALEQLWRLADKRQKASSEDDRDQKKKDEVCG